MNSVIINLDELSALNGLPHLQQLLYLRGIRPYVDYQTGIVGLTPLRMETQIRISPIGALSKA
jgi:hypothetical protein